jgi:hypothetical protein
VNTADDAVRGAYVKNLSEVAVVCLEDVMDLLARGAANVKVAATALNAQSSRSHTIFRMVVESRVVSPSEALLAAASASVFTGSAAPTSPSMGAHSRASSIGEVSGAAASSSSSFPVRVSVLNLVDLAGSERASAIRGKSSDER